MIALAMETLDPKAEYIVKNGKATAVILPLEQYTELLEDLHDLAVIARRKNEPTIPLAEVKARLRRNGALRRRSAEKDLCKLDAGMRRRVPDVIRNGRKLRP